MALISVLFRPVGDDIAHDASQGSEGNSIYGALMPPDEEQIPSLVDRFLQNVHTKNPVLDVEQLVKQARNIASRGLGWGAWSCLVLLACSLGTIGRPFDAAMTFAASPNTERDAHTAWTPDAVTTKRELQQAECYFALACRRLGSLKHSILGSQCYFFAGGKPNLTWKFCVELIRRISLPDVHIAPVAKLAILHAVISSLPTLHENNSWPSCRYFPARAAANPALRCYRQQETKTGRKHVLVLFQERE